MDIRLGDNIKTFRKERKMTQEQLAEALGVTVGAVYKWESKASMPEIRLLLELADLFGTSVDALLGYELQSNSVDDVQERIQDYLRHKDFASAISEAEKALLRYPNSFRIVRCCYDIFLRKGVETGDRQSLLRAIELMERAIPLLGQNSDPEISEFTIRSDIAICYIKLGQTEKGLEILKKSNTGGINSSLIGITHTMPGSFDKSEAELYLTKSFGNCFVNIIRCMTGCINYHIQLNNPAAALDASLWLIDFLSSIRNDEPVICYLDKLLSFYYAASAMLCDILKRSGDCEEYLKTAYRIATAFDAAPDYTVRAMRFSMGDPEKTTASDDTGTTAIGAIDNMMKMEPCSEEFKARWQQIKQNSEGG